MGEIEEEDKKFLIIDKDTGKAYDIRNENHIEKITRKTTRITQEIEKSYNSRAWDNWWKQKRWLHSDN